MYCPIAECDCQFKDVEKLIRSCRVLRLAGQPSQLHAAQRIEDLEAENEQLRYQRDLLALNVGHLPDRIKIVVTTEGAVVDVKLLDGTSANDPVTLPGSAAEVESLKAEVERLRKALDNSQRYNDVHFEEFCNGGEAYTRGLRATENPHELGTHPHEAWKAGWLCSWVSGHYDEAVEAAGGKDG